MGLRQILKLFVFCIVCVNVNAQNTVGLLYNSEQAANGYVLFSPFFNENTYLIDNCGYVVNQWDGAATPQLGTYLNADGDVIRSSYAVFQRHNWDNELMWAFSLASIGITNHHDIEVLPNGNILTIHGEYYSQWEAINNGRDSLDITESGEVDGIIELQPIGMDSAIIVWQWSIKHHLVQDYDSTKQNFGIISEHSELLNINFPLPPGTDPGMEDWYHLNAVDYNQALDQILISSRNSSEIYIIDHSTTSEEAAGHIGGLYNKGGDFLWRWGNPQIYHSGSEEDRKFSGQHDAKWIEDGYQNAGMISAFSNGAFSPEAQSRLCIVDPSLQSDGTYEFENGRFLPEELHWSYSGIEDGQTFYVPTESGAATLPNGNVLATMSSGEFFEVSPSGERVWAYQNPAGSLIVDQGEYGPTTLFKAQKYDPGFQGFVDKEFTNQGYIENINTVSDTCQIFTQIIESDIEHGFYSYPNPAINFLVIESDQNQDFRYQVFTMAGIETISFKSSPIDISSLTPGIYLLNIVADDDDSLIETIKFIKH